MGGEKAEGGATDLVEVVENARLVCAESSLRLGISNLSGAAGEVDAREKLLGLI